MATQRNMTAEQNAINTFNQVNKKLPTTAADWAAVHHIAYPTIADLPTEFHSDPQTMSYYPTTPSATPPPAAVAGTTPGSTPPAFPSAPTPTGTSAPMYTTPLPGISPTGAGTPTNNLPQTPQDSNLPALQNNVDTAYQGVQQTMHPGTAMDIFQQAARAKAGTANVGIGQSSLFGQAGVTGFGALQQSLQATGTQMAVDRASMSNFVGGMSAQYKDMANLAMFNYNASLDAYNKEKDRLQAIMTQAQEHRNALDTLQQQNDLAIKLEAWKNNNPGVADKLSLYNNS